MNIKSLLLGSAAALVAVSGARAADAVVIAEPEPMEYVRICDTYGVGFFYIPGTETCLKVSGYLRYDIGVGGGGVGNLDVLDKEDDEEGITNLNDTYDKRARFALRMDARSETELGTLRAYAQVNFHWDVSTVKEVDGKNTFADESWALNHAYIELGGLRIGKTDSLFTTLTGYSSGVSNDGLVPYGPFDTHQIAYTFTGGNGFTAAVALEEGEGRFSFSDDDDDDYTLDSYVPHVVGGVGYTGGWGGVSVVAGYDANWEEGAIKGRVDFNANDAISLFVMGGWATVDEDWDGGLGGVIGDSPNFYAPWGGEWAIWVGGAWKFNEKATFNFEIGYDDLENFSTVANVDYELVPNLSIIPEIIYVDNFDVDLDDNWGGFLRVQRTSAADPAMPAV
jgi:hypothetical protein